MDRLKLESLKRDWEEGQRETARIRAELSYETKERAKEALQQLTDRQTGVRSALLMQRKHCKRKRKTFPDKREC